MHRGFVMTGFAGVEGQPGPGSSVLRVPSVLVEKPKDEIVGVAVLGQLAVMVTGLAQAVLPYLKVWPLPVVTEKPVRPPVAVCQTLNMYARDAAMQGERRMKSGSSHASAVLHCCGCRCLPSTAGE
jgi:hypothetical protein